MRRGDVSVKERTAVVPPVTVRCALASAATPFSSGALSPLDETVHDLSNEPGRTLGPIASFDDEGCEHSALARGVRPVTCRNWACLSVSFLLFSGALFY